PEAPDVLTQLRNLGIGEIALLTGDRRAVAETVASQLGIEDVHAELLPEQKASFVSVGWVEGHKNFMPGETGPPPHAIMKALNEGLSTPSDPNVPRSRRRTAFVGDGINDAPALACAHVGLAIGGTGTEVAAEAGDIVFMGDPLRTLPLLVRLSRETVRIIRQNIILFAFGVNAVGVVITGWLWPLLAPAGWWYEQGPLAAVLYHQGGSLLVLLNAMRLLWFERPPPRLSAWRQRFSSVNAWMDRNLDVDRWLHGLGHHRRKVLLGVLVVVAAVYALTGLTQVN